MSFMSRSPTRFSNWSRFRMDVSSRLISLSSARVLACRSMRVYSRAFSMLTAMREAIRLSSRACSSLKKPRCGASISITPITRFLVISGTARYALADLYPRLFRHFAEVADLEPETEFLSAFIQQQDGEHFIVNHPLDHLGYSMQQGVQIQSGVQHIRDFHQKGFDVHAWGNSRNCGYRVQELMITGNIQYLVKTPVLEPDCTG